MTQETKLKLKQAAETAWEQDQKTNPAPVNPHAYVYGFKAGAQTILDNYHDYGLQSMEKYKDMVSANVRLGAENQRLLETLEQVIDFIEGDKKFNALSTAKEALKQQDDEKSIRVYKYNGRRIVFLYA